MKQKIFVVQLQNSQKPSSKSFTPILDAVFYSNDTDAHLRFLPHEQNFDFTSADIVLYNHDDETLVTRAGTIQTYDGHKSVVYKMDSNVIAHWGSWSAQCVFKQGTKINSAVVVKFDVRRHLKDARPPKLEDVESLSTLVQSANQIIQDLEDTLETLQQQYSSRARIYSTNIGNNSAKSFTINHNLGTTDVVVSTYLDNEEILPAVRKVVNANSVLIEFATVWGTNKIKVVIVG